MKQDAITKYDLQRQSYSLDSIIDRKFHANQIFDVMHIAIRSMWADELNDGNLLLGAFKLQLLVE